MSVRLNKVLTELNIGLQTAIDYLKKNESLGEINYDANMNTKINDEQYEALIKEFRRDKYVKNLAGMMFPNKKEKEMVKKGTAPEPVFMDGKELTRQTFTPLGKVDLNVVGKPVDIESKDKETDFKTKQITGGNLGQPIPSPNIAPKQMGNKKGFNSISPCISIGKVKIDWKVAIGQYEVTCIQDVLLNAFDKVICGLLEHHDGVLDKIKLGDIMGLNIINDPNNWKYQDQSECKILEDALQSLREYGIIDYDSRVVYLTQTGRESLQRGKKQRTTKKHVTLYFDLHTGKDLLASELFSLFSTGFREISIEESLQLDEERIRTNISSNYPELVDADKGRAIGSIETQSVNLYMVSIPVDVIYNFTTSDYDIELNDVSKDVFDICDNEVFRDSILNEFFGTAKEATIYKPNCQIDLENSLELKGDNKSFICSRYNFINSFVRIAGNKLEVVCLYLDEINENILKQIVDYSEAHKKTMVCVEYVNGDESFNDYYSNNLGIQKRAIPTTHSVCVCSDDSYFSDELFVFSYKEKDYQLPVILKHKERKYRISIIASPFANRILPNMIEEFEKTLNKHDYTFDYKNMQEAANEYAYLSHLLSLFPQKDEDINFYLTNLWQNHLRNCVYSLRLESEQLLLSNNPLEHTRQFKTKLEALTIFMSNYSQQLQSEIRQIRLRGLNVIKRNAYIVDTSAFIANPKILNDFDAMKDIIYVPKQMYEELDTISHENSNRGNNAKSALNNIIRVSRDRPHFLKIENLSSDDITKYLPNGYDMGKKDNHMLALALKLKNNDNINEIIIITTDNPFEHKALIEGITVKSER